jgi:hypothetical protein
MKFTPLFKLLVAYIKDVKKDIKIRKDGSVEGVHLTNSLRQPYNKEQKTMRKQIKDRAD